MSAETGQQVAVAKMKVHSAPQCEVEKATEGTNDENAPVILHPLVVLNVSDHYTRYAAMKMFPQACVERRASDAEHDTQLFTDGGKSPRVLGMLLGTQKGRIVEVCHSFELPARISESGQTEVDDQFMNQRIEQYQQIFANYSVVGWYCIGSEVTSEDLRLHKDIFSVLTEAPLLLQMNPNAGSSAVDSGGSQNPEGKPSAHGNGVLVTYHMELKVTNGFPKMLLVPVPHRYASEDSERIAVDHVMRHAIPGGGDGTSSTTLHLGTLRRSITMLKSRVELIVAFLDATASGQIEVDHDLLRQVSSICARLPAIDCAEFSEAFDDERNDSLVVTYLSGVTKSLCAMYDAVEIFNKCSEKPSPSGGGRRRAAFSRP